jgi:hypothetical protein
LITATRLPDRAAVIGRLDRSPVMAHSTSRTRGLSSHGPDPLSNLGQLQRQAGAGGLHPKRVMNATIPGATFRSIVYAFGPPSLELSGPQYAGRNSDGTPGVAILRRLRRAATPSSAIGLIMFAAVMMFQFDVTTWGWIQLILGIVVALAGVGLLAGRTWARVVGITLAVLSAIANFMFIPHHPVWALLVIALDVFVIWALAAHGRELRDASP